MDKMDEAKYSELTAKYLSGNIDPKEREELLSWVQEAEEHRVFFDEMIQLWGMSGEYEASTFETDTGAAWNRVAARLSTNGSAATEGEEQARESRVRKLPSGRRRWMAIAATLLLLAFAGWWWYGDLWRGGALVEVRAPEGERRQATLPDGSRVWLNQNTRITYRENFQARQVELQGEAFFEVEPDTDSPFTIRSGAAQTRVVGTSFNVRAYPGDPRVIVTVETGKVKLSLNEEKQLDLKAGSSGMADPEAEMVTRVEVSNATSWKTRMISFKDTELREAIPVLERYFDLRFELENDAILNCPVSIDLQNPTVDEALSFIDSMLKDVKVEYRRDGRVHLKGKGCPDKK